MNEMILEDDPYGVTKAHRKKQSRRLSVSLLIDQFSKNLSPCTSCGKTDLSSPAYNQFFEKRNQGEKVKFILQVEVEADDVVQVLAKKAEGTVLSINPRPQQAVTGSQHQSTQRVPTPQVRPNG